MPRMIKPASIAAVVCAALLAAASPAAAKTITGTVVHRNAHASSFVVASKGGGLSAIHARRLPAVGRVVRVAAKRLRNGTFAARRVRARGHRSRARIRGSVSFVDAAQRSFVVSAPGASIRVRRAAGTQDKLPAVGTVVSVDTTIDEDGDLESDDIDEHGDDHDGIEIEGIVLAVDPAARTITVSADDDDESGQSVLVHVPVAFDLSAFVVGNVVELKVVQTADGFVLSSSDDDGDSEEADDDHHHQASEPEGHQMSPTQADGDHRSCDSAGSTTGSREESHSDTPGTPDPSEGDEPGERTEPGDDDHCDSHH